MLAHLKSKNQQNPPPRHHTGHCHVLPIGAGLVGDCEITLIGSPQFSGLASYCSLSCFTIHCDRLYIVLTILYTVYYNTYAIYILKYCSVHYSPPALLLQYCLPASHIISHTLHYVTHYITLS